MEIKLNLDYPKVVKGQPQVKMLTPIFHPNINPTRVCIADNWTPQEFLDDLVIRIGQMITFQAHNTKSPLNGAAARWTDKNLQKLPVDDRDIFPPESIPTIKRRGSPEVTIPAGSTYEDESATAKDELEGSLTSKVKTTGLDFDTSQPGTHTIRYNVKNKAGVAAKEVVRKVVIEEVEEVEITILGETLHPQDTATDIYVWPEGAEDWDGPHPLEHVQKMVIQGKLSSTDYAAFEDSAESAIVADIPGFSNSSNGQIKPKPQPDKTSNTGEIEALKELVNQLRTELAELRKEVATLKTVKNPSPEPDLTRQGWLEIQLVINGEETGPHTWEDVQTLVENGDTTLDDYAWFEGCEDWITIGEIPDALKKLL